MTREKREQETDAHWNAVWERLRQRGIVDTVSETIPYCASSCAAIAAKIKGGSHAPTNVRTVLQNFTGARYDE